MPLKSGRPRLNHDPDFFRRFARVLPSLRAGTIGKGEAARKLGISHRSLVRYMKQYAPLDMDDERSSHHGATQDMKIKDRVKEFRRVRAAELIPNPKNWRRHPEVQQQAIQDILDEIGYAGALLAYETPEGLMTLDGHLRAKLTPDQEVPVLVLDITEAEADKLLATFDPLTSMAETDHDAYVALADIVETRSETLQALMNAVSGSPGWPGDDPDALPMASLADLPEYGEKDAEQFSFVVPKSDAQRVAEVIDHLTEKAPEDAPNRRGWALVHLVDSHESSSCDC